MTDPITWYDVLDVLPGASTEEIRDAYRARADLLRPDAISGASPKVLAAADRALSLAGAAWRVLGDPESRRRYDHQAGIRARGLGLDQPGPIPSEPLWEPWGESADLLGAEAVLGAGAVLAALADFLTPHPVPSRRVEVPDVRGLFVGSCRLAVGDALRLATVLLTGHPMPVEGLVVDQSPQPGVTVRRASTLTVQVWHPPRRAAGW
jgi:hypothetical protein